MEERGVEMGARRGKGKEGKMKKMGGEGGRENEKRDSLFHISAFLFT